MKVIRKLLFHFIPTFFVTIRKFIKYRFTVLEMGYLQLNQQDKKIDSWAIKWYASAYLHNMYTLYPRKSLIKNIGLDGSGTHNDINNVSQELDCNFIPSYFPNTVKEEPLARMQFENYFLSESIKHRSMLKQLYLKIQLFYKRLL